MKRNLSQLADQTYDIIVVGGGILGISVARDAAMRGLKVALVEQGDFGNATSANHHKIIHGGLRYLQHGDFKRMRESIRERSILMRIAPHLVRPLPFLIPTYSHRLQSKLMMSVALKLNDAISFDRNRRLYPGGRIPKSRVVSKGECLQLCPDIHRPGLTGGAIFFDGQIYNPDRFNMSVLLSAEKAGSAVANYVQMIGFVQHRQKIVGIKVRDRLSELEFVVQGRLVVNCAGPWINQVLLSLGTKEPMKFLKAVVLVTRQLVERVAVGVASASPYTDADAVMNKGYRYLFITPWRHTSLVGTFQTVHSGNPESLRVTEQEIVEFIRQTNAALPGGQIKREDVYSVLYGLVPRTDDGGNGDAQLKKHSEIRDNAAVDNIEGLVSATGVKYTTARATAEKTVDLALNKLGRKGVRSRTSEEAVSGGEMECPERLADRAIRERPANVSAETLQHLLRNYGSEYQCILRYCNSDPKWSESIAEGFPVIKAEVVHGVRSEMAQKLGDVILRRTELGTAGHPGTTCLYRCAGIMAEELGWDKNRVLKEVQDLERIFSGNAED